MLARVVAVSLNSNHTFSKTNVKTIKLSEGLGIEGDAHFGRTVQHLYLKKKCPERHNRRQVHLMASERIKEWQAKGHAVWPGSLGENITTEGLDLERLPKGTRIRFEGGAQILLTGLRKPCRQIENFSTGLLDETISKDSENEPRFLAGIMAIVESDGYVSVGDKAEKCLPGKPFQPVDTV